MLRQDALRLFQSAEDSSQKHGTEERWNAQFNQRYRSYVHASKLGRRDGTAFAAVALPAHYSAILSVMNHLKKRMGPDFTVRHVVDWGAGTGSGLWYDIKLCLGGETDESLQLVGHPCTPSKKATWKITRSWRISGPKILLYNPISVSTRETVSLV